MIINLEITFTPQTSIDHRVCWKETTDSSYDCSTIATGCVAGVPKTVSINVTVFNESCDDITYEGYVQPICEPEASLLNRTAFPNVTFTPDQPCNYWEVVCAPGIDAIGIVDNGSGYTPGVNVPVTITGGGGAGATGECIVTNNTAITAVITNPGSGYIDGSYAPVNTINVAATGTGLILTNVIVFGGQITGIILAEATGGSGYTIGDTVTVDIIDVGGFGSGAIIEITSLISGTLQYCNVINPGSGYTSTPLASISGNGEVETGLNTCSEKYNFGLDCSGAEVSYPGRYLPGIMVPLCRDSTLAPLPAIDGFVPELIEEVCCYECEQTGVEATSIAGALISYVKCGTRETSYLDITCLEGGCQEVIICHVTGTLNISGDAIITSGPGPCTPA